MTITARTITDSVSPQGIRLFTVQLRYPKFIHGELMTHRVFSRNASSSRAIPAARLIQDVMEDPAMPVYWGMNQLGMQAAREISDIIEWPNQESPKQKVIKEWLKARDAAVERALMLAQLGVHKQIVNRIIEPWCHINVLVTSTEWANFFALRLHEDAQPEMRALANEIWKQWNNSVPTPLMPDQWHLPYVDISYSPTGVDYRAPSVIEPWIKASVARCARVSYLTHDMKDPNLEDDLKLYERLVGSEPLHASPAEHQATPDNMLDSRNGFSSSHLHGNFRGWLQWRKMLPHEAVHDTLWIER